MKTLQLLFAGPRRQTSARTSAESDEACQRKTKDRAECVCVCVCVCVYACVRTLCIRECVNLRMCVDFVLQLPVAKTRSRHKFAQWEVKNLLLGVKALGCRWADIGRTYRFNDRTSTDLRKKYKQLQVCVCSRVRRVNETKFNLC